jgi:peptidoglycan/LPS O-acetylase OafA/YrhL
MSVGLRSRVARFFGRVPYSLYLVHSVVLLALLDIFFDRLPKWAMGVLYGLVSVVLSYLFCVVIEEPAHRLEKVLGTADPLSIQVGDEQDGRAEENHLRTDSMWQIPSTSKRPIGEH